MAEDRKKIPLAEVGIEDSLKVRKALTGALVRDRRETEVKTKGDRLRKLAAKKGDSTLI